MECISFTNPPVILLVCGETDLLARGHSDYRVHTLLPDKTTRSRLHHLDGSRRVLFRLHSIDLFEDVALGQATEGTEMTRVLP